MIAKPQPRYFFCRIKFNKSAARRTALQALAEHPYTLVFYEAPHRILESVADLQAVFGDKREIVLARELTKLFESIHRCPLGEAVGWLSGDANNRRGEFVLLVAGAETKRDGLSSEVENLLALLLEDLPLKQAVQLAVKISGANKNELYQRALELKNFPDSD